VACCELPACTRLAAQGPLLAQHQYARRARNSRALGRLPCCLHRRRAPRSGTCRCCVCLPGPSSPPCHLVCPDELVKRAVLCCCQLLNTAPRCKRQASSCTSAADMPTRALQRTTGSSMPPRRSRYVPYRLDEGTRDSPPVNPRQCGWRADMLMIPLCWRLHVRPAPIEPRHDRTTRMILG
jgi:hypothetical protein